MRCYPPPCKNRIAALCRILFAHSIPARIITTAIVNCKRKLKNSKIVRRKAIGPCRPCARGTANLLAHGSQSHSSNIPPGHHSESSPHSPAGRYRWDNPAPASAPWSHPAQPLHFAFRRKQKIRTLLLLEKSSDFHGLVRVVIQHFLKTIVVQFVFEVIG